MKVLVKLPLTTVVVFTSVMGFAIAAGGAIQFLPLLILGLGGFMITGAANALNQILERDYDKLMERTADRPVASGRMAVSEALIIAGVMLVIGLVCLSLFNPLAAFLGMLSFVLYAFIYTPMKRFGPLSVAIGAIPGAMPALIGCVAFEGTITWLAIALFGIQFLWQFPHFWAIGWLSFEQYQAAGFKLVPSVDGKIDASLGRNSLFYAALLVPLCFLGWWSGVWSLSVAVLTGTISLVFAKYAWGFFKAFDRRSAKQLMFSSFLYLPIILIVILIGALMS